MRILLVEDNTELAGYMKGALQEDGHAVDWCTDGDAGLRHVLLNPPDVLVLDRMLPGIDGVELCAQVRAKLGHLPILMITALGTTDDRVTGLDAGADDYLVKPFDMRELLARVRALLRRPPARIPEVLVVQDLALRAADRVILCNNTQLDLTAKEYAILEYLMHNVDRVVTRQELLEHCWEFGYNPFSNITDVYIRKIRQKLHDDSEQYIETLRGVGYRLRG